MDRREATQTIKAHWRDFYPADGKGKGKGIICPICKSGSGKNGTGITVMPRSRNYFLKCWNGGCKFEGGSVIDLYMMDHRLELGPAVDEMAKHLGIEIDPPAGRGTGKSQNARKPEGRPSLSGQSAPASGDNPGASGPDPVPAAADPGRGGHDLQQAVADPGVAAAGQDAMPAVPAAADYTQYYAECFDRLLSNLESLDYMRRRGFGVEEALLLAEKYNIGFDPAWVSPTVIRNNKAAGNPWMPPASPRLIIPTSATHYVARDTRPDAELSAKERERVKMNEGKPDIFGWSQAMGGEAENIFVTEGAFDALSVLAVGHAAIALVSTSNVGRLLKKLEANPTQATLILCLDSDESGRKAAPKLRDGLRRLNVACVEADINGGYKDPSDHFAADRSGFEAAIARAISATAARPDSAIDYITQGGLVADIERRRAIGVKPTGFANLDAKIGGGLRPGLILLGAISSLGKTTFCSQMADGLAAAGSDVIYFSLEQSRLEMVAKSLSRETAKIDMTRAVKGNQIMDGHMSDVVRQAAQNYIAAVGNRVSVIEAGMNSDTQYITEYVRNYHKRTGTRPVVFVDYLQIMAPGELPNGRKQDKRETVEECLRQLVLLKRELDLTIIAIVSLNRNNYLQPFDFECIKETGLAEYSADVVWGLQLQCLDDPVFSEEKNLKEKREKIRKAKEAIPRKVKLCSVKHRGQQAIYDCCFDYFAQYDLFVPADDMRAKKEGLKKI